MDKLTPPTAQHELETLIRSRAPLIVIETHDELRALELLASLAVRLAQQAHLPVFQWKITEGLRRIDVDLGVAQTHNSEPTVILKAICAADKPGVYVLLDFHPFLNDPIHVRLVKDICLGYAKTPRTLVLVSHELKLPAELANFAAQLNLAFPTVAERQVIVEQIAAEWSRANKNTRVKTDERALQMLVDNLAGLSSADTERLARTAIYNDGAIIAADLPEITRAKHRLLNRNGVLAFEPDSRGFVDLGGMQRLKQWLKSRVPAMDGSSKFMDVPRGMLLLGVQGCGKSLAARVSAGILGVPLLRLDVGALFNKYIGESERSIRETLATAEATAPCVLWLDEIEKGFSGDDHDSGTSQRVLASFLTWLSEKRSRVFVVATANDITKLPPELVRKGRFDEIFFVDLPSATVRADILRIHAGKRGLEFNDATLKALAQAAEGFSGAELEQAIVSALYTAHGNNQQCAPAHVLAELRGTRPLSVVMSERIADLREWAAERTVPAD
ncbi:MAG: AAA family ATPase [Candidatus Obscuribacterales bacterium]|nr:AAA family ATPase [Steroidobacteraceae bacterium]